jgi:hypothetical protein
MSALENISLFAKLAAGALLTVAAGRFLFVAAFADLPRPPTPSASPSATAPPERPRSPDAPRVADGVPIRIKLVVNVGVDRSSVKVDGAVLGKTPLITETSCRAGQPLQVIVIEPSGKMHTFSPVCEPGTLRITEP